jgi:hypothetical protein
MMASVILFNSAMLDLFITFFSSAMKCANLCNSSDLPQAKIINLCVLCALSSESLEARITFKSQSQTVIEFDRGAVI